VSYHGADGDFRALGELNHAVLYSIWISVEMMRDRLGAFHLCSGDVALSCFL